MLIESFAALRSSVQADPVWWLCLALLGAVLIAIGAMLDDDLPRR